MTSFDAARRAAPAVFDPIAARFDAAGIGMLGTVRADGSPRISPIEVTVTDGQLVVGMMPDSRKCVDVLRDPRVCLLTPVADREDLGGEGKLFGRLLRITDPDRARTVLAAAAEAAGVDVELLGGSPVFELDVEAAAWQWVEDDTFRTRSWAAGSEVRERGRTGALGSVVDL